MGGSCCSPLKDCFQGFPPGQFPVLPSSWPLRWTSSFLPLGRPWTQPVHTEQNLAGISWGSLQAAARSMQRRPQQVSGFVFPNTSSECYLVRDGSSGGLKSIAQTQRGTDAERNDQPTSLSGGWCSGLFGFVSLLWAYGKWDGLEMTEEISGSWCQFYKRICMSHNPER